ncbi:MAG: non-hydrolyzing UDP-N-acetylglucosamine 2-epimerase [Gammaproteobacteria bacterium]
MIKILLLILFTGIGGKLYRGVPVKTIAIIVGTRPEAIKLAPLILALQNEPEIKLHIIATGQHQELVTQVFNLFGIQADVNLQVMRENQSLSDLTSRLLSAIEQEFKKIQPDAVVAQGDTTSVLASGLASFYNRIPFFHVEAGLRSGDIDSPFPEEANRIIAGRLAALHFAPTVVAQQNLLQEGVAEENIYITGNTVVDALHYIAKRAKLSAQLLELNLPKDKRVILVTMHRRENFGKNMQQMCYALLDLVKIFPDVHFVVPIHPNPNVRFIVGKMLVNQPQITLCSPLDYQAFVALMQRSYFVLSDSGGVQEEAPALGKPVLVLRKETERAEGILSGAAKFAGIERDTIVREVMKLLIDHKAYTKMCNNTLLYGDGLACTRIINAMKNSLGLIVAPLPAEKLHLIAHAA